MTCHRFPLLRPKPKESGDESPLECDDLSSLSFAPPPKPEESGDESPHSKGPTSYAIGIFQDSRHFPPPETPIKSSAMASRMATARQ